MALIPTAGSAQVAPPTDPLPTVATTALLLFGMLVAGYFALQAFNRPAQLDQFPTLPRYLTPLGQYRLGAIMFIVLSVLFYWLITYFHRELFPLVQWVQPDLYASIEGLVEKDPLSYPVVVVLAAAAYLAVLKLEHPWNPLLILRDVIHRWVSIPYLADTLAGAARNRLRVPPWGIQLVLNDSETPHVRAEDFAKSSDSLDRRWAESSYLFAWLSSRALRESDGSFFNEPHFGWEAIHDGYVALADRMGTLKGRAKRDSQYFARASEDLRLLRRKLARLVACLLVVQNDSQAKIFAEAQALGIDIRPAIRDNPLKYSILFVIVAALAVYLSVTFTSTVFDFSAGASAAPPGSVDSQYFIARWTFFGVATYCVPITGLLFIRYLGWRVDPARPQTYVVSYAWMFAAAICLATIALAATIKMIGSPARAALPYHELLLSSIKWTITPALTSIYVIYHLDRRIDPTLPDINVEHRAVFVRVIHCVLFALFAWIFILPPTVALQSTSGPWTTWKVQVVALITSYFTVFALCLTAQFGIAKAPSPQSRVDLPPRAPPLAPAGG